MAAAASVRGLNKHMMLYPRSWGVFTATVKTSAADLLAQKGFEKREKVDLCRNLVFSIFGALYLGTFQYYIYHNLFVRLFPGTSKKVAFTKMVVDQLIHCPFLYYPAFYVLNEKMNGGSVHNAAQNYRSEFWEANIALWKIWIPAQYIGFAFVPSHLHIPYISGVSFLWCTLLSLQQAQFNANRTKN